MRKEKFLSQQGNLFAKIPSADELHRERRNKLARQRRWLKRLERMPEGIRAQMKRVRELVELELYGQP